VYGKSEWWMLIFLSLSPIFVALPALLLASEIWAMKANDKPRKLLKFMGICATDNSAVVYLLSGCMAICLSECKQIV
jgi:hypothetical protein